MRRLLWLGILLTVLAMGFAAVSFLKPKDELKFLRPYVVKETATFSTSPWGGLQRSRILYLGGISLPEVSRMMLAHFPKRAGWEWSGNEVQHDVFKEPNHYEVGKTPIYDASEPNLPMNSTARVEEDMPLDGNAELWERIRHLGRLPIKN